MASKIRRAKAPKDVNAPKRNLSAYFLFTNKRRAAMRIQYPEKKLTELTTVMAVEWKSMDPVTKKQYLDQAIEDKENYHTKMAEYQKTSQFAIYQAKLSVWKKEQQLTADKKAAKKPKDLSAPKKPATAYFLFTAKIRAEVTAANPTMKITEIAKVMGQKWKGISEEEKKVFQAEALRVKEQHKITVSEYQKTDLYRAYLQRVTLWEQEQQRKKDEKNMAKQRLLGPVVVAAQPVKPKVSLPRKPKDPNAPKKNLSSYLLFSASVRAQARAENPEMKLTQIAGVLGQKWKALSKEEQQKWSDQAAKNKAEYLIVVAEYKQSENFKAFEAKMAEWTKECEKRKQEANEKFKRQQQFSAEAAKQKKLKSQSMKKKTEKSKAQSKKRRFDYDSDSSCSSSYSSYSTSSSGSTSGYSSSSSSGTYSRRSQSGTYSHSN